MIFSLHEFRFFSNTLIIRRYSLVFSILPSHLYMDEIFDSIKDRFEEVIYKASELPALKELEAEDIQCLHMGKKVMRGSILL